MTPAPTLHALTSARFFAAAIVLVHHYHFMVPCPKALLPVLERGQAGVCFFFLLSGFILTYNYHHWFRDGVAASAARAFYRARFARVYPMHLLALLACTPLTLLPWLADPARLGASQLGTVDGPLLAVAWLAHATLVQDWLPLPVLTSLFNGPAWSISCELFFYLLFPFLTAFVLTRLPRLWQLGALALGCLALEGVAAVAAGLAVPWLVPDLPIHARIGTQQLLISTWMPLRVGEFVIGCALGTAFVRDAAAPAAALAPFRDPRWRNAILAFALAGAVAVCFIHGGGGLKGYAFWVLSRYVIFVPFFAAIIYALASGRTFLSPLLERPWLLLLGEASYALYLLHYIPIQILGERLPAGAWWPGWVAGLVGLTLAASIACHLYVERPARRWLRGAPAKPVEVLEATPSRAT